MNNSENNIKNNLERVMKFLQFDRIVNVYKCGSNKIIESDLKEILLKMNYKEESTNWFTDGKNYINVKKLTKIVEVLDLINRD